MEIKSSSIAKCFNTWRTLKMEAKKRKGHIFLTINDKEALVLSDWLNFINQKELPSLFQDQAEQRVLFDLEAELEKVISTTLTVDYNELLKIARDDIRDKK